MYKQRLLKRCYHRKSMSGTAFANEHERTRRTKSISNYCKYDDNYYKHDDDWESRHMSAPRTIWQSWAYAAAGLSTAVAGNAAFEETGATWPTILVVAGLFVAATGIRGLSR
jgi:hypothetical protein